MMRAQSVYSAVLSGLFLTLGCSQQAAPVAESDAEQVAVEEQEQQETGMHEAQFSHSGHTGYGYACTECHHTTAEGSAPAEGCSDCHPVAEEGSDPAHKGPEDNTRLQGENQCLQELAAVPFNHFTHASADGYKLACTSCHHTGDTVPCSDCHDQIARLTPEGAVKPKLKRAVHLVCKNCHSSIAKNNPATPAPVACEQCHSERTLARLPGALTHERAMHLSCIGCHAAAVGPPARQDQAEHPSAPTQCIGCHIPPVEEPVVADADGEAPSGLSVDMTIDHAKAAMSGTPFAHADHQGLAESCDTCHHEGLADPSCRGCHGDVDAAQRVYHKLCIECHQAQEAGPTECAGCHP